MASSINASLSAGLVTTADTSGIINLQSNGSTIVAVTSTGAAVTGTLSSTGNTTLGDASTDTLNVGNGNLVTDASGNVGVGVTPSAWSGNGALQIAGNIASNTNFLALYANGYYSGGAGDKYITTSTASRYYQLAGAHVWQTAPSGAAGGTITFTQAMTLDATGNLYIPGMSPGGTTNMHWSATAGQLFYVTSALKYKHDVRDVEEINLNLLRPVRYKSKNKDVDGDGDFFGFIADEAHEKGLVELVTYRDGEVDSFKYDRVTPLLWKIAQQQQALITSLTARLDEQQAQISVLQGAK